MNVLCLQPALPHYRVDFFDRLAAALEGGLAVYYSQVDMGALTDRRTRRDWERPIGPLRRLGPGLEWQSGALPVPLAGAEVLIVCGAPRTLSTLLLILRARALGVPVLWWGQYWSATTRAWRFRLRMLLMRMVDGVALYTDAEVAEYRAGIGAGDRRPVGALNNGINVTEIRALRQPYRPEDRDRAVLFVGRLTEKAGLGLLIGALADPRLAGVRLEVIGDGAGRQALEERAVVSGVDAVWHGGTTDEARIAAVANRCLLFCYPGQVGLSLIHAMAYGLPAVIHSDRRTQMPEFAAFGEGETGWSFPPGDAAALAGVLARAMDDAEGLASASAEAVRRADGVYNTEAMAGRMADLLRQVAEARR